VTGVVGIVGATVLACKATIKAEKIVEETHEMLDDAIDDAVARDIPEKYRKKAIFRVYARQSVKFAKIYAPSLALGASSLALIIGSHCVLNRRYLGTTAAYKAVEEAYRAYRRRVAEEFGEDKEKDIYYGRPIDKKEENNVEDTEAVITPNGVVVNPRFEHSPYARFFDENSPEWKKNSEYNQMFLRSIQKFANNTLRARGHLFLNEVYDWLGIPRSQMGAVVGWLLGAGDDYVDFGLDNPANESARDFVNGYDRSILLDFNVDGVIYDKI